MKKGIEYLSMLSKKEQVLFLKNLNNMSKYKISTYLSDEYESFYKFMAAAFVWKQTSEGNEFWYKISVTKEKV